MYGIGGLGFSGFVFYITQNRTKLYLTPLFIHVCFNFVPFLSQVLVFLIGVQEFPGMWTTYGGALLFLGCTLLSITHNDQMELARVPLIKEEHSIELLLKPDST